MPDPNQDRPISEQPPTSEPTIKPPWQEDEEIKLEGETVEEKKEETDLSKLYEEKAPSPEMIPAEEISPETPPIEPISSEEAAAEIPLTPTEPAQAFHAEGKSPLGTIKKFLPIILGLILVVALVVLVIKVILPRFQKAKEITLTYWGLWEPDSVMRQAITDWNKEHPNVKVNYSMQSKEQYRERLQSALARGAGPDIFRFHITWGPMLKKHLDPVPAEVMSSSQFDANFYPVAATHLRSGANYLGIPLEVDTLALFYNKTIFQTAGKSPPTTWDELRRTAIELTTYNESGRIQTAGAALGTTSNVEHWSDILGLMMLQNEADLTNPTDDLAADALVFYTIFNKTDRVWDSTLPGSMLAFANGKLAMYFGFSWDVFEIKNINPNLDFGIVQAPQLAGTNISWASFWAEGISNKSENKEAAWEFLEYLSSKETLTKLYQSESQLRLFGEPYPRVEMASQAKSNPLVAPFVDQAPIAQTWYLCSRTFDNGINDKIIDYFEDAVNAVNAEEDPLDALETAASGVAQVLSNYELASPIVR